MLGTFVEIAVMHSTPQSIEGAFAAIQRIETLMNVHHPDSELSLINRSADIGSVWISPEMTDILSQAIQLFSISNGIFDVVRRGGSSADMVLSKNHIELNGPLFLDLSGIAKGFAVDQAVAALIASGVTGGIVNAGGDLRYFGEYHPELTLRHPQYGLMSLTALNKPAVATSMPRSDGDLPLNVTVAADTCTIADALTKVVLALGDHAESVLSHYGAMAFAMHCDSVVA